MEKYEYGLVRREKTKKCGGGNKIYIWFEQKDSWQRILELFFEKALSILKEKK